MRQDSKEKTTWARQQRRDGTGKTLIPRQQEKTPMTGMTVKTAKERRPGLDRKDKKAVTS